MGNNDYPAFLKAVVKGDHHQVKKLFRQDFLNQRNRPDQDEFLENIVSANPHLVLLYKQCTPLHIAAYHGHESIMKLLIDRDADVSFTSNNGLKPMHLATIGGQIKAMALLKKYDADVNCLDFNEQQPSHIASAAGNVIVMRWLMENGANSLCKDKFHRLPFHYAAMNGHVAVMQLLIDGGTDPNVPDSDRRTPIHYSAINGHLDAMRLLLNKGADPNSSDGCSRTPIHYASMKGHTDAIKLLMQKGANANCTDIDKRNPIHYATWLGQEVAAKILLHHKAKYDCADRDGRLPIHYAAMNNHMEMLKILVDKGSEKDLTDNWQMKPIHYAAINGHVEAMEWLTSIGVELIVSNKDGRSLIHFAAWNGHEAVAQFLLGKGLNPNCEDNDCRRPIHYAAWYGHVAVVKLLLDHGADPKCPDKIGMFPMHYAAQSNHLEVVKMLLDKGVNPNCTNQNKSTPLHSTSISGNVELMQLLKRRGANINHPDENGLTPLHVAAKHGNRLAVEWLLRNKADPNCKTKTLLTPLIGAAYNCHTDIMELLLSWKADPNCSDDENRQAIHFAAWKGCVEGMRLILKHGGDVNSADADLRRPIHFVAMSNNVAAMQYLLHQNANLSCRTTYGTEPFHYAAKTNSVAIMQWLLICGCSIECETENKWRPIHYACVDGCEKAVQWLVSEGCIIDTKTSQGKTPVNLASMHPGCVRILEMEQAIRKKDEYKIFHFPRYSILSRMYNVYDWKYTMEKIRENLPETKRPIVVCHFPEMEKHLPPPLIAVSLVSKIFTFPEYVVMNKDEGKEQCKETIKGLRDWNVSLSFNAVRGGETKIWMVVKKLSFNSWRQFSLVTLKLPEKQALPDLNVVDVLLSGNIPTEEIKETYVEFLRFVYRINIYQEIVSDLYREERLISLMEELVMLQNQILTFYDRDGRKMVHLNADEGFNSQLVRVHRRPVNKVQFMQSLSMLSKDVLLEYMNREYLLVRCITDDGLVLAMPFEEFRNAGDMKGKVELGMKKEDRLLLVGKDGIMSGDKEISGNDRAIHYAIVKPFENITLLDKIGKGAFGSVFRCQMPNDDKIYAIKKIKFKRNEDTEFGKGIQSEILAAARIGSHKRIIKYHGFFENQSAFFILMDCMQQSLSGHLTMLKGAFDKMNKSHGIHPLGEEWILRVAKQILEGLKYLHDNKVIHRDLKGSNVLLDETFSVKLTDFGVSKCITNATDKASIEGGETEIGTCRWMAPEVLCADINDLSKKSNYGLKVDIWSFGATLVEMITGHPPYHRLFEPTAVLKIAQTKSIEFEYPSTLSSDLNGFVKQCLISDPLVRPNCSDLLAHSIFDRKLVRGLTN